MSIEEHRFDDSVRAFELLDNLALEKHDFIFRGHTKEDYKLTTTLHRHYKTPHEGWSSDIDEMLDQFRTGLTKLGILPFDCDSRIDWLEYARHYGVPTPILDFSYSPYIAIFFAFSGEKERYKADPPEYSVVYALNIKQLAWIWATLLKDPQREYEMVMESFQYFLYPTRNTEKELFEDGFPGPCMQFIPAPGKYNFRMQRQQGALLYDTIDYRHLQVENLDELIDRHKETDTHLPNGQIEKGEPTLHKIFINKNCTSEVFSKLEIMGINGGTLYMNAEGVAQDVINAYGYNPKTSYLRGVRFRPPND